MSGVIIARGLLAANMALVAVVPSTKIMAGVIPINTILPAISVAQISGTTRNTVSMNEAKVLATDRVQITAMAKTYAQQKQIIGLIQNAMKNTYGLVSGIQCDSITTDVQGPDIFDAEAIIYFQSIDFMIKFSR